MVIMIHPYLSLPCMIAPCTNHMLKIMNINLEENAILEIAFVCDVSVYLYTCVCAPTRACVCAPKLITYAK